MLETFAFFGVFFGPGELILVLVERGAGLLGGLFSSVETGRVTPIGSSAADLLYLRDSVLPQASLCLPEGGDVRAAGS